ncbi:hypothetical protein pb186bvf_020365 [Paramecium bursaria]
MADFFDDFDSYGQPAQPAQPQLILESFNEEAVITRQPQSIPQVPEFISPEQQQRKDKLKILEDERIQLVREREESEKQQKQAKREKAQQYLHQFNQQLQGAVQSKKQQNRQQQEVLIEARKESKEYKNSWDKVAANIALKDGEYPGQKDVTKMRQAILNKKIDLNK